MVGGSALLILVPAPDDAPDDAPGRAFEEQG